MASPERQEAIKALAQLATLYHISSPTNKADHTAIRLRNRAAVLQLATHANITEEAAAEKYFQQLEIQDHQRRREAEIERLRNATNGGVPYDYNGGYAAGQGSPTARRHYLSRSLGSPSGSPSRYASNGSFSSPTSPMAATGGILNGPPVPPPQLRRDTAIGAIESLVSLANSYASTGRFTDAVRVIKRAIAYSENQFKSKDIDGQRKIGGKASPFRKSSTVASQSSIGGGSAPTVSSIHNNEAAGRGGSNSNNPTVGSPRRVGFADGPANQSFGAEALQLIYDNNAMNATDVITEEEINLPQLVPLLVLLSTYLDAEGSRHEAQCIRDRIRNITENVQGIGLYDATFGKTDPRDDIDAMDVVLAPVGEQIEARERLIEEASPEMRRRKAEDLLRQRTGGGNISKVGGSFLLNESRKSGVSGRGDASPGSIAAVRGKNYFTY